MNIKENRKILILLVFLIALFMSLIIYLSYFTVFKSAEVINHPANRREALKRAKIKRGNIYDRKGELIAYSEGEEYKYTRHYNYPESYSHLVGYSSKVIGNSGIEASYNKYLLGATQSDVLKSIRAFLDKNYDKDAGDSLYLTTNTSIQEKARELLSETGEKGAIVVMNPKTGEVLSMVSYPDFNLETIERDYAAIVERNEGSFYNSAMQGGFAPGSIQKIVSAAAIIESGVNRSYKDTGEETAGGYPIKNAGGKEYGNIDLKDAFTYSVNTYFANKSIAIGKEQMGKTAEDFYYNKSIDFDLNTSNSKLNKSTYNYESWDNQALASASIGQADVSVTPLHMCMVVSAIANNGKMMQPYLVSKVVSSDGSDILTKEPTELVQSVSPEVASEIKDMMIDSVNRGTGKSARLRSVQVAGKTGTAERSTEKVINNAWFVGFAPADDPQIAVAVVIENVQYLGGEIAAPMAKEIMQFSLEELSR
ncbi:peptidoglycan D,D-transpeptidase FtsI family protein [Peptoniphilus catoniae]|uniref:peptidoglycan D,D-transpeptidase FtsI family protein n=1 Tax=Peptoniphilus catoniae TaxID=1660341 RepID=UPI0010FD7347|nr:penicillin-binding protein 2 [Peptoniphilus catoniae]